MSEEPHPEYATGEASRWYHAGFFWVLLASLSMGLPEVLTMNDPLPWIRPGSYVLGYPVYGLHILVLGALMYRRGRVNPVTLLAYGGLFGLYEGYLIKQLWNPNWAEDVALSIGGVRVLHTLLLVFSVHTVLAFIAPLALAEIFLTAPGPLRQALPFLRRKRGTLATVFAFAVWAGLVIGSNMHSRGGRAAMAAPIALVVVVGVLGGVWRTALKGNRFSIGTLLPQGPALWTFFGLLCLGYIAGTRAIRPEALPGRWLPHVLVWGLYAFLIVLILLYRNRGEVAASPGTCANGSWMPPWWVAPSAAGVFLVTAFQQSGAGQPGHGVAVITLLGGAVANVCFLCICLWSRLMHWVRPR